ncbi:MAG: DNA polymerase I [Gammaproteobacteria bacterium]|nr:DNA polymerase I [Gammaproteobacteria bacterium]
MPPAPRLVLVDGSSYLYRAFHALPPLSSSRGEPTGAVLGVLNMLHRLLREEAPQLIAVVMDAPGRTFRDELFADYKAHRPPMPDELRAQVAPLIEAVQASGLPLLRIEGVEADDVIGTLAKRAAGQGIDTLISSGDKDMAQLVGPQVTVVDTMAGKTYDRDAVIARFDVAPEQIIDYLALVGDSSDNIPGVPKVGPKTAARWLKEYGTLDNLRANADRIPGKVGESLREHLATLELSRQLATINCSLDLGLQPQDLRPREPDSSALRALYERLELRSLLRQLDGQQAGPPAAAAAPAAAVTATPPRVAGQYETVLTREQLARWLERIEAASLTAFDTETTSLDYMQAELVGLSLCTDAGTAAYVPVAHRCPGSPPQLSREEVLGMLRAWLESPRHAKVGHHLKYDAHVLANHGIRFEGMVFDTMLESYVLNSTAIRHDMDSAAKHYLGRDTIRYEEVAGKGASQIGFEDVAVDVATVYAAEDADVTLQLHQALWPRLQAEPALAAVYRDIEQPLVPVLLRMEEAGVLVDARQLRAMSQEFAVGMAEIEKQAHTVAGRPFNLSSPKQLLEILFEQQQLPVLRKTPTGQPSTAEDVLEELAAEYPLPRLILDYRALAKLKSTYTDKLPAQISPRTGRIHTSYHQAVAATGRLSSSDPNLQNIPIRTDAGRRIRQAFIAPPGQVLVAADYSQIELRIMAHLSGDEGLLAAFAADADIHRATAAEVFGVESAAVSSDQRRSAKAINFGLIYGMSAFGLARQLGIGRDQAQDYVDRYFARYPGVKAYMDRTRREAHERGYVETVFGRRLYLQDIQARQAARRQYAERSAINAPMQGSAADIIKKAMLAVDAWLAREGIAARLTMQVHDELVLEVQEQACAGVMAELPRLMSAAAQLRVPLRVDVGAGANWDEAH